MVLKNQEVLITGGTGFIGSNIANELVELNDVSVLDSGHLGIRESINADVTYHEKDILADNLPTDVDVVFHLAGLPSYAAHEAEPRRGLRVNVEGFVNVVAQARNSGCSTVVFASSASVYGRKSSNVDEDAPKTADTAYQASKIAREQYAEYFSNHFDLRISGLRLFSVYQEYERGGLPGGKHPNYVAQIAEEIAHDRAPPLYRDRENERDFTHVDDVVQGFIEAASHRLDGIYNLGTGRATSLVELIGRINDELGTSVEPSLVDHHSPGSAPDGGLWGDCTKIQQEAEWEPKVSLEEGIERVCARYTTGESVLERG